MTPEQRKRYELAAEIVQELREWAFDGDRWLGNQKATEVVERVLEKGVER